MRADTADTEKGAEEKAKAENREWSQRMKAGAVKIKAKPVIPIYIGRIPILLLEASFIPSMAFFIICWNGL